MSYSIVERGSPYTPVYKVYIAGTNGFVSPFHDIPLFANPEKKICNMVVEIPRWTNAKMEINKKEALNPIMQDVKNGKLRFVHNCFPYHGYIWNYGALPQTWENPNVVDKFTKMKGDNDPLDACEIGNKVHPTGAVIQVKVLGALGLIDDGEADWKVIVIDCNDPKASSLNDIGDVDKHMPGYLKATVEWFRIYKIPAGKPPNEFAFGGEVKNRSFALEVIQQDNEEWTKLMNKKAEGGSISCSNTTLQASTQKISQDLAGSIVSASPRPTQPKEATEVPSEANAWSFVKS